jgi:DNA-binding transcriptional regulator YiaG
MPFTVHNLVNNLSNSGSYPHGARMNAPKQALNIPMIVQRLRALMVAYDLSVSDLAAILQTSPRTVEKWFDRERPTKPPACLDRLLTILEKSPQARKLVGLHKAMPEAPRGKPFKRGNPYRFTSKPRR